MELSLCSLKYNFLVTKLITTARRVISLPYFCIQADFSFSWQLVRSAYIGQAFSDCHASAVQVKDGGILVFVTSSGTLDKKDESVRQMLADKADLIGAIRLPVGKNGAFHDNAGTDVDKQNLSWKEQLNRAIDEVIKVSEDFEDHKKYTSLEGKAKTKYKSDFCHELDEYNKAYKKLIEQFPDGHIPKLSKLKTELEKARTDYAQQSAERKALKKEADRLSRLW